MIMCIVEMLHMMGMIPRSPSCPDINVGGRNMLCARIVGLIAVGLVPSGLDGAYEKRIVWGKRAVFCCAKSKEMVCDNKSNQVTKVCIVVELCHLYLWLCSNHSIVSLCVIQSRQGLQDIMGNKTYLFKTIPTLPPALWRFNYLRNASQICQVLLLQVDPKRVIPVVGVYSTSSVSPWSTDSSLLFLATKS